MVTGDTVRVAEFGTGKIVERNHGHAYVKFPHYGMPLYFTDAELAAQSIDTATLDDVRRYDATLEEWRKADRRVYDTHMGWVMSYTTAQLAEAVEQGFVWAIAETQRRQKAEA